MTNKSLPQFWKGSIGGTTQGAAFVRMKTTEENLSVTVVLEDFQYGACEVQYDGKYIKPESNLNLILCHIYAPMIPTAGQLRLSFDENMTSVSGSWSGDNSTGGLFHLRSLNSSIFSWWCALSWARLRLSGYRWRASLYTLSLLVVALLAMSKKVDISYPVLILLLVPAPFVFRYQILEFIRLYQIKKIGWVEMGDQGPITEAIQSRISNEVQARLRFSQIDTFFVHRTKLVLLWLAGSGPVEHAQFDAYATSIGVAPESLRATWDALITTQCATARNERIEITSAGRSYASYLTEQFRAMRI